MILIVYGLENSKKITYDKQERTYRKYENNKEI